MISRPSLQETAALRRLLALMSKHLWFLPPAVALGLLGSFVEGVGLSLFVPLFQTLEGEPIVSGNEANAIALLYGLMAQLPSEYRLAVLIVTMLGTIVLKNLVQYLNLAIFVMADARASHELRCRSFARTLTLPLARVEQDSSGRVLNAIGTETWRVSQALSVLFSAVTSICAMVVFIALLLLLSWQLTLIALVLMAIVPVVMHVLTRHAEAVGREAVASNALLSERLWAGLMGLRVIRAYGQEDFERERFSSASAAVRYSFTRLALVNGATGPASEVLVSCIIAGLALAMDPRLVGLPTLVAFVAVLYRLQPHVRHLIGARVALASLAAAVSEVRAVVNAPTDPAFQRGGTAVHGLHQAIQLEGVCFTHAGTAEPALRDVSFRIAKGTTVAIVGPSGAGKSTLLDLLLGFHAPDQGCILIDDVPLSRLDVTMWRRCLGVVGQDAYLADATVRENVLYGRPEATAGELREAARAAGAEAFIEELPQGWDTPIGERGVRLSGGQRQRLALARALVRRPDVLLLDEATNALDSRTEREVQDALAGCAGRCTIVVVAHRLATVERANLIVVLDRGRIVEAGSFASLVRANGLFAHLYQLQSLGHDLREVA